MIHLIKKLILEEVKKIKKVICDNCGWSWNIKDGGDDPYTCHKCGHDNNPDILNEKYN
jgi:tRNA(Ile2) C34 agmatinyltransferase TiaS